MHLSRRTIESRESEWNGKREGDIIMWARVKKRHTHKRGSEKRNKKEGSEEGESEPKWRMMCCTEATRMKTGGQNGRMAERNEELVERSQKLLGNSIRVRKDMGKGKKSERSTTTTDSCQLSLCCLSFLVTSSLLASSYRVRVLCVLQQKRMRLTMMSKTYCPSRIRLHSSNLTLKEGKQTHSGSSLTHTKHKRILCSKRPTYTKW